MTDAPPSFPAGYTPPNVWTWDREKTTVGVGRLNRPTAGAIHEKALPVGRHPLQLYSLATPNGVKVTVMLEELLEIGREEAEYDAWLINLDGDQFGSGFVDINPNSKIPAMVDRSGPSPVRIFESGSILVYLAEKFSAFLPASGPARAECFSWLFWQMSSTAFLGGGFGHFFAYAPIKIEYAIDRYADIATWPWYGALAKGLLYNASEFLSVHEYKNVRRWTDQIAKRPAVRRGRVVNKISGASGSGLRERHDASDFIGLVRNRT
jgi:GSH-dependent disulfide-bond oxidoreductase